MNKKQFNQVYLLSESYIGEGYLSEKEVVKYISDPNTYWIFSVQNSQSNAIQFETPETISEEDTIIGFIWGRLITVQEFTEHRFSLPQIYTTEKQLFEVPTWVVHEDYQDQSIGTQLIITMAEIILATGVYPVISSIRKSRTCSNDHLAFISQFGTHIESVPDKPDVICSVCGSNCTCKTVIFQFSEEELVHLYHSCTNVS